MIKHLATAFDLRHLGDILGLPPTTTKFSLHVEANKIVRVECEYYPEITGKEDYETIFQEYVLVKKEDIECAES